MHFIFTKHQEAKESAPYLVPPTAMIQAVIQEAPHTHIKCRLPSMLVLPLLKFLCGLANWHPTDFLSKRARPL